MMQKPEIYLDNNGEPIGQVYLDDSGEPVSEVGINLTKLEPKVLEAKQPEVKKELSPINKDITRKDTAMFDLDTTGVHNWAANLASKLPRALQKPGGIALDMITGFPLDVLTGILGDPTTPALGIAGALKPRISSVGSASKELPELVKPSEMMKPAELINEKPSLKLLGPAKDIQLPSSDLSIHTPNLGTGKPAELLHPNRLEPASEILHPIVQQAVDTNPIAKSVVETAAKSGSPELAQAVNDPSFIEKYVTPIKATRDTPIKRTLANVASSVDTELSKQNPILGELVKKVQADSAIKAGTWTVEFDKIVKNLSDEKFSRLVDAIEGKVKLDPVQDKSLVEALSQYQVLDREVSDAAINSSMGLKSADGTKAVPWQPRDNYWPHLYTEEFFNQMKNNPADLRAKLIRDGKSPLEIDSLFSGAKRYGERLISPQHGREVNLPGYRVDKNVYREHLAEMARRITESEHYGPMDLADSNSPLVNLIKETKNPQYTEDLMKKLLNREVRGNADFQDVSRKATGLQAWLHLGTAGISNINTAAMPLVQANTSSFIKGLTDTILSSQKTGEFAESAGAIQNIFKEIFAQIAKGHSFSPTKVYGLDAEEKFMRTVSAATGRAYVKQLFTELKSNPGNERAASQLRNLILEDPKKVLSQTELNELQIKRAAFRTAELSQGLADKQNLPSAWTGSGMANLLTLFHKYQFAQTKIIKDAVLANPVKAIPLLFGMSQIAGEITGDAKAAVKGGIRSLISGEDKISGEVAGRANYLGGKLGLGDNSLASRMIENAAQSFALGVYADVIEAMGGTGTDALKQLAGSTIGDLIRIFDMSKKLVKGEFGKAGADAVSFAPVVGPPVAAELRENQ